MNLSNKVVLITGSTQGIGAETAKACVAAGARVMLHGRNQERAEALAESLGEHAAFCVKDLMDADAAEFIVAETMKHFGRLDVLVNNAAIFPRNHIGMIDAQMYEQIMTINLKTPLFLCQQAIHIFRNQPERGVIVNIGSINADTGQSDLLIYSISKGGLMTMTRNLGDALSQEGIRVNQLNVGWTVTDTEREIQRQKGLPDDWEQRVPKMFAPRGHLLRPEEVAHHVVFWSSDLSAPVTGQVYACEQYPTHGRNLINVVVADCM